jgi:hypothetical protein
MSPDLLITYEFQLSQTIMTFFFLPLCSAQFCVRKMAVGMFLSRDPKDPGERERGRGGWGGRER